MIGGGCAVILHENLATEPCVATSDVGWIVNDEKPATKQNTHINVNIPYAFQTAVILFFFAIASLQAVRVNQGQYLKQFET